MKLYNYECELIEPSQNPALDYLQREWSEEYGRQFIKGIDLLAQYDSKRRWHHEAEKRAEDLRRRK